MGMGDLKKMKRQLWNRGSWWTSPHAEVSHPSFLSFPHSSPPSISKMSLLLLVPGSGRFLPPPLSPHWSLLHVHQTFPPSFSAASLAPFGPFPTQRTEWSLKNVNQRRSLLSLKSILIMIRVNSKYESLSWETQRDLAPSLSFTVAFFCFLQWSNLVPASGPLHWLSFCWGGSGWLFLILCFHNQILLPLRGFPAYVKEHHPTCITLASFASLYSLLILIYLCVFLNPKIKTLGEKGLCSGHSRHLMNIIYKDSVECPNEIRKQLHGSKLHGCVAFFSRDHQIIRLIYLSACSGDNFKQVFPTCGLRGRGIFVKTPSVTR